MPGAVTECLSRGTAAPLAVYETARAFARARLHRAPRQVSVLQAALGNGAEDCATVRTAKPELRPCCVAKHEIEHATDDHEDDNGLDEESDQADDRVKHDEGHDRGDNGSRDHGQFVPGS